MASFDSGARMDSAVRYDEAANPNTTRRSYKMPAITLDLDAKDDATLGEDTRAIILATDGKPKYAAVQTLITALKTASGQYDDALTDQLTKEAAAKAATQTKKDKRGDVEGATAALANGLMSTSPAFSDADVIEAKFTLRAASAPVGEMPAVIDFLATMGDTPGENDLTWSAVKGRRYYDVEYRLNVPGSTWIRLDPSPTKSKATVSGLQSGEEYVHRVRAVGTAGPGPWSDVSIKRAP